MAALREGVIEKMELQIGMPVKKGGTIGDLHHEMAELTVAKNELQAASHRPQGESRGPEGRRRCRSWPATSGSTSASPGWSRPRTSPRPRASSRSPTPQVKEADENRGIAKAELDLADRTLKEHTIVAPFDGVVIKRMKNPGESVRANEAVVQLGNLNRLCADAYVPLEYAFRVKEGQIVEIQPRITGGQRRAAAHREEAIPGQDHVRRSPDPAGGRDGGPDPRRVRQSRGRAAAGLEGADDDLPDPGRRGGRPDGAAPTQTARNQ